MEVKNSVNPSAEQLAGFAEPGPEGPIYMVNLLKFKPNAEYADGRQTELTGAQAYDLYGQEVAKLLVAVGGAPMFSASVERLMLGEVAQLWDKVAIAMYPSRSAMLEMLQMDKMREISVHREAGLEGQLNIETADAQGVWLAS